MSTIRLGPVLEEPPVLKRPSLKSEAKLSVVPVHVPTVKI